MPLLAACMAASGACALAYEVVWARMLGVFLGASAHAHAIVLAGFLGGLAVGNSLFGRWVDRRPERALAMYAVLELAIGLYGLLSPEVRDGVEALYGTVAGQAPPGALLVGAKLAAAAAFVVIPTVAIGGTLPVLTRYLARDAEAVGSVVSRLYLVNTLGAAAGVVAAGLVLVPAIGTHATVRWAGAVNVIVGLVAGWVWVARRAPAGVETSAASRAPRNLPIVTPASRWLLAAVTLMGVATLTMEVVWTRVFAMVLGSSAHAFTIMLATFIAGIAVGAVASPWLLLRWRTREGKLLGGLLLGAALLLCVQLPFYERLPYWQFGISHALERRPHVYPLYLGAQSLMAFMWMVPLTVLAGAALPVAIGAFAARSGRIGAGVGALLTANTLGNVVGPLVATFVLFPLMGLRYTVTVGVALLCGAALLAWWSDEAAAPGDDPLDVPEFRPHRRAFAGLAAGVVLLSLLPPAWDPVSMHAGGFRRWTSEPGASYAEYRQARSMSRALWSADGPADSVAVIAMRDGARFMKVNGKTDASDREDLPTQRLVAHIPLLLHEAHVGSGPRDVFVVGLGSGATAGSASLHPEVEVTVAELSGAVIDASRWFTHVSHDVHARSNVRVRRADAREWLARAPGPWDVIINQPSNPWIAGNAALFSREFFALARDRLAPDGVFAQWMHVYAMDDATLRVVLETFASVFPHVTLWWPQGVDLLLVGSLEPLSPDLGLIAERITAPWFIEDMGPLREVGAAATNLERLLSLQVMSDAGFRAAFAGTPPFTTDAHALVEHRAPRAQFVGQRAELLLPLDERTQAGTAVLLYLGGVAAGEWRLADLLEFFAARDTPFSTRLAGSLQHAVTGEAMRSWDAAPADLEGIATRATGLPIVYEAWTEAMLSAASLSVDDCRAYLEMGHRVLSQRASIYHLPDVADFDAVISRCAQAAGGAARPFLIAMGAEALAASGHGDRARRHARGLLADSVPAAVRRAMEAVVSGPSADER